MNEFIIENAERVPFRGMSEENKIAILKAKLNAPKSVEMYCGDYWGKTSGSSLLFEYIYRVRAIASPLVIPWEVISPEWNWAAMDEDTEVWLYSDDPVIGDIVWCLRGGNCRSLDQLLIVPTTGIVWDRSKTRRPV